MNATVVITFGCAVLAAAGTGVLVGRCIRAPRMDIIAWAFAVAAIAASLGAQALGAHNGYTSATFRTVQVGAQLIAPLWLAWGMVELAGRSIAARFGAKLVTAALTVVGTVILITDPLAATPFTRSWPRASTHYQIIARSVLDLVAVVTVVTVVVTLILALARLRRDPGWRRPLIALAAVGAAAAGLLSLRFGWPANVAYPAVCAACAGLACFGGMAAVRVGLDDLHELAEPYDEEEPYDEAPAVREAPAALAGSPAAEAPVFGTGYPRRAEHGTAPQFRDDDWYRLDRNRATRSQPDLSQADRSLPDPVQPDVGQADVDQPAPGQADVGQPALGQPALGQPALGQPARSLPPREHRRDEGNGMNGAANGDRERRPAAVPTMVPDVAPAVVPGAPGQAPGAASAGAPAEQDATQRLFGLIAIYTLAEGRAADFDSLAERVVGEVRAGEPDTLVYAVHSVPNAPMQRIFYEVYRDHAAYEEHQRYPHIQRFGQERAPYVVATNVIELGTQQAKLSPLPGLTQMFGHAAGD